MHYRIVTITQLGFYAKLPYLSFGYWLPAACIAHVQKHGLCLFAKNRGQKQGAKTGDSTLSKGKKPVTGGGGGDGGEVPTDVSKIVDTPCASVLFRSSEYK